ncbi:hypothetical protein EUGRSUZ_L00200 [Eucalyptus grandis]|uniref:Uncharacterized protein n=1 Tax=Eucalyptus grandis TaxID=71139 RepID=A0A058ZW04_EUCGR|nr:hypothetical protein EUGRSUZ_L00200 [Eucalyptus grandis]
MHGLHFHLVLKHHHHKPYVFSLISSVIHRCFHCFILYTVQVCAIIAVCAMVAPASLGDALLAHVRSGSILASGKAQCEGARGPCALPLSPSRCTPHRDRTGGSSSCRRMCPRRPHMHYM